MATHPFSAAHSMPALDESSVDALLRRADIGAAAGRGAKLAPALNAQPATLAALARALPFDCEAPGFARALERASRARTGK